MRIVASMTTIPSRIDLIRPVIEAALSQTVPVERVEINVPGIHRRTGQPYVLPSWLEGLDRLSIFRTEDYGPITKIAPTLLRYKDDPQTYVWSIDDDCAYPPDQLALLCRAHVPEKRRILTRYGGHLDANGAVQFWYGEADVTMFEGFGGVLYPPACVGADFQAYVDETSANEDCRKNDDIVLAMYFTAIGLPIHLYNVPTDETPYMVSGWLPHAKRDALHENGHAENYRRIHGFLRTLRWFDGKADGSPGRATDARPADPSAPAAGRDLHVRAQAADLRSSPSQTHLMARTILRMLLPRRVEGHEKIRVGRFHDGGYVMIDDFAGIDAAYSFGINDDVSWDLQIAARGLDVFQYDHTIDAVTAASPRCRWVKTGLSAMSQPHLGLETLPRLIERNGHRESRNLLLKCDIEGAEWPVLAALSLADLARFKQIVIELHDLDRIGGSAFAETARQAVANLTMSHRVVHVHANNWGRWCTLGGFAVPSVIEVTLVRASDYALTLPGETFPTELDQPNNSEAPDFFLGAFAF